MRTNVTVPFAHAAVLAMLLAAGCSQQTIAAPLSPTSAPVPSPVPGTFRVLYAFAGGRDGAGPNGTLVAINGVLYGPTNAGGTGCGNGCGTVFSIDTTGTEKVLYRFQGSPTGAYPFGRLTAYAGALYGALSMGAPNGAGVVYRITPQGREREVWAMPVSDALLYDGLAVLNGNLYGSTDNWGANYGAVFQVHRVHGGRPLVFFHPPDGFGPNGTPLAWNGKLYATTTFGGANNAGTVFEYEPGGAVRTLFDFPARSATLGGFPQSGVVELNGKLYGATGGRQFGSRLTEIPAIYELDPSSGALRIVHEFTADEGEVAYATLTVFRGKLYGTAIKGGNGRGTVFEVNPSSGAFRVLHRFNGRDGSDPTAGLTPLGDSLYGVARSGGQYAQGVVFAITP